MRNIQLRMWCTDGIPHHFQLEFNGVPQARQNTSGSPVFKGESEVMVQLNEFMGPNFEIQDVVINDYPADLSDEKDMRE